MHLKLQNIGIIKEADVYLDGMTVIAGENDTGKSTVGKFLFALIKADMISLLKHKRGQARDIKINRKRNFDRQIDLLFSRQINSISNTSLARAKFYTDNLTYVLELKSNKTLLFDVTAQNSQRDFKDAIFIQTPFIWDLMNTFQGISNFHAETDLLGISTKIQYPYLLWDLFLKLNNSRESKEYSELLKWIEKLIGGKFKKNERGEFKFFKGGAEIELNNVATGIKLIGILQRLIENSEIQRNKLLIIDEPEVHLHPKWQLEVANIVVYLVKKGIRVLVNSHSPYMIEALKRYSEIEGIKLNLYLAEGGSIVYQYSMEAVFEKLAMPMRTLRELKLKRYFNG